MSCLCVSMWGRSERPENADRLGKQGVVAHKHALF